MIIAVDFDDTIHDPKNRRTGYRMGQPVTGAILSLQRLAQRGHTIVVFTARNVQDPSAHKALADWLSYFQIPFHEITNVKSPKFDLMIDNRGVHFEEWSKTMWFLDNLTEQSLDEYTHQGDTNHSQ